MCWLLPGLTILGPGKQCRNGRELSCGMLLTDVHNIRCYVVTLMGDRQGHIGLTPWWMSFNCFLECPLQQQQYPMCPPLNYHFVRRIVQLFKGDRDCIKPFPPNKPCAHRRNLCSLIFFRASYKRTTKTPITLWSMPYPFRWKFRLLAISIHGGTARRLRIWA